MSVCGRPCTREEVGPVSGCFSCVTPANSSGERGNEEKSASLEKDSKVLPYMEMGHTGHSTQP